MRRCLRAAIGGRKLTGWLGRDTPGQGLLWRGWPHRQLLFISMDENFDIHQVLLFLYLVLCKLNIFHIISWYINLCENYDCTGRAFLLLTPYVPFLSCFAGFLGCFSAAESLHNEHSGEVDIYF